MNSLHVSQKGSLVHFLVASGAVNSSLLLLLWWGPYTSDATLVPYVGEVCFDEAWMVYHHLGLVNIDLKACPSEEGVSGPVVRPTDETPTRCFTNASWLRSKSTRLVRLLLY